MTGPTKQRARAILDNVRADFEASPDAIRWALSALGEMGSYKGDLACSDHLLGRCIPDSDGCLIWQGATSADGLRPQIASGSARRRLWVAMHGRPVPQECLVVVRCRKKLCLTPECLALSSLSEIATEVNARADVKAKIAHASRLKARRAAKLNEEIAAAIRVSDESNRVLGDRYGVDPAFVGRIKRGVAWRNPSAFEGLMR